MFQSIGTTGKGQVEMSGPMGRNLMVDPLGRNSYCFPIEGMTFASPPNAYDTRTTYHDFPRNPNHHDHDFTLRPHEQYSPQIPTALPPTSTGLHHHTTVHHFAQGSAIDHLIDVQLPRVMSPNEPSCPPRGPGGGTGKYRSRPGAGG